MVECISNLSSFDQINLSPIF